MDSPCRSTVSKAVVELGQNEGDKVHRAVHVCRWAFVVMEVEVRCVWGVSGRIWRWIQVVDRLELLLPAMMFQTAVPSREILEQLFTVHATHSALARHFLTIGQMHNLTSGIWKISPDVVKHISCG